MARGRVGTVDANAVDGSSGDDIAMTGCCATDDITIRRIEDAEGGKKASSEGVVR